MIPGLTTRKLKLEVAGLGPQNPTEDAGLPSCLFLELQGDPF